MALMEMIVFYVAFILSRVFAGRKDGDVSITEIELSRARGNAAAHKADTVRRDRWHRSGAAKRLLTAAGISILAAGFSPLAGVVFVSLLSLQVLIFNPVIAFFYLGQNWTYLSPTGWDGFFKRTTGELAYYLINAAVFAGSVYTIFSYGNLHR